jgi:hypothetical protein
VDSLDSGPGVGANDMGGGDCSLFGFAGGLEGESCSASEPDSPNFDFLDEVEYLPSAT